jgi:hypothetical protein
MNKLVVALLAMVGAAGCESWLTRPSLYNTVEVITSRRNGDPIPGVPVELYTGQRPIGYGVTGPDGRFAFTRVPQGLYGVIATAVPAGYDLIENLLGGPATNAISGLVVANDSLPPTRITFLKQGPGTVTVRVADAAGPSFVGLPVKLYSPSRDIATALTDSAGRVTFNAVPYGQYGIVVTRPYFYRDYKIPGDSAYAFRDGLLIEDGSRDSVIVNLKRCAGTVRISAVDSLGVPVPLVTAALYTPTANLGVGQTDKSGQVLFPDSPCAFPLVVFINPAAGYTAPEGRGTSYLDGLVLKGGDTLTVVFRLQRAR